MHKYSLERAHKKQLDENLFVYGYRNGTYDDSPIDGAYIEGSGIWLGKIMHNTYEQFYIFSGSMTIETETGKVIELLPTDMIIIPPETVNNITCKNVKGFITCNPPFNSHNMEFH